MIPELRKVVTYDEDIHRDGEKVVDPVLRVIGVAAVVKNPWFGQGFVEDLKPGIDRMAPRFGQTPNRQADRSCRDRRRNRGIWQSNHLRHGLRIGTWLSVDPHTSLR